MSPPNDVQICGMAAHPEWSSSSICPAYAFTPGSVILTAHPLTVAGFEWGGKNADTSPNASGHLQLLLSARILGMTLVPEGKVWNHIGLIDLTQIPT